jgi:hypothetical protein
MLKRASAFHVDSFNSDYLGISNERLLNLSPLPPPPKGSVLFHWAFLVHCGLPWLRVTLRSFPACHSQLRFMELQTLVRQPVVMQQGACD